MITNPRAIFFCEVLKEQLERDGHFNHIFSGDSYEAPPVPIPNTVVKLVNAESTWVETPWEDR